MKYLVVAALAVVVVCIWQFALRDEVRAVKSDISVNDDPATNDLIARQSRELMNQRMHIAKLAQDVENLKNRPQVDSPAAPNESAEDGKPEEPPFIPLSPEEEEAINAERIGNLDDALEKETQDTQWSAKVYEQAKSVFDKTTHPVEMKSLECGASFCRVVMSHETAASRPPALDEITAKPPFNTEGFVYIKDPESKETIVYFSRSGEKLPTFESKVLNR